jgi:methylase of polypeptide subunit release factors
MGQLGTTSRSHEWVEASDYISEVGSSDWPSVFAKAMAETIPIEAGKTRLLDIGCGSGIIGIYCLVVKRAGFVTFNDILEEMVSVTRKNVERQIKKGRIFEGQTAYLTADYREIPAAVVAAHDLIEFNPPQLPMDLVSAEYRRDVEADPVQISFRRGGADGLDDVRRFLEWYARLETPKPNVVILLSSFLGRSRIAKAIQAYGLTWKILNERTVPLRRSLAESAERLSRDRTEAADRSIEKDDSGGWIKKLLTGRLSTV